VLTTGFTYARLRLEDYTPKQIVAWKNASTLAAKAWRYTLFQDEDAGKAPGMPASY